MSQDLLQELGRQCKGAEDANSRVYRLKLRRLALPKEVAVPILPELDLLECKACAATFLVRLHVCCFSGEKAKKKKKSNPCVKTS